MNRERARALVYAARLQLQLAKVDADAAEASLEEARRTHTALDAASLAKGLALSTYDKLAREFLELNLSLASYLI